MLALVKVRTCFCFDPGFDTLSVHDVIKDSRAPSGAQELDCRLGAPPPLSLSLSLSHRIKEVVSVKIELFRPSAFIAVVVRTQTVVHTGTFSSCPNRFRFRFRKLYLAVNPHRIHWFEYK